MDDIRLLALGVAAPVTTTVVTLAIATRLWQRELPERNGQWGAALALGLAMLPAFLAADAWSGFPPSETWKWLVPVTLAATLVSTMQCVAPKAAVWPLRVVIAAGAAWVLVGHWVEPRWLWRAVMAAVMVATQWVVDDSSRRAKCGSVATALCVVASGGAVTVVALHNLKLGVLCGALAAGLAVTGALGFWRGRIMLAGGGATLVGVLLPAIIMSAWFQAYDDVPKWTAWLIVAAPLGLLVDRIPPLRPDTWQAVGARITAVAIPTGVAAAMALYAYLNEPESLY